VLYKYFFFFPSPQISLRMQNFSQIYGTEMTRIGLSNRQSIVSRLTFRQRRRNDGLTHLSQTSQWRTDLCNEQESKCWTCILVNDDAEYDVTDELFEHSVRVTVQRDSCSQE